MTQEYTHLKLGELIELVAETDDCEGLLVSFGLEAFLALVEEKRPIVIASDGVWAKR